MTISLKMREVNKIGFLLKVRDAFYPIKVPV